MDTDKWLRESTKLLERAGIGTARLDALVLLEEATNIDRARLLAKPTRKLSDDQIAKLEKLLKKRSEHVPLAYLRGRTEFYGREFIITPAVLEPRPESEAMIDELKALPKLPVQPKIADVGAGSGALGITAKLELTDALVELLELDPEALEVAKMNVDKFTLDIKTTVSDLLLQSSQKFDVLLCNLPYVPDDYQINTAALHEPRAAIFGGPGGLDVYHKLFEQVKMLPLGPLYILCEALPPQHEALQSIATKAGYTALKINDFIIVFSRAQK